MNNLITNTLLILVLSITLTACTHQPSPQPAAPVSLPETSSPSQNSQSTGDPQQDLDSIEADLNSLDSTVDFPAFSADDFTQ